MRPLCPELLARSPTHPTQGQQSAPNVCDRSRSSQRHRGVGISLAREQWANRARRAVVKDRRLGDVGGLELRRGTEVEVLWALLHHYRDFLPEVPAFEDEIGRAHV